MVSMSCVRWIACAALGFPALGGAAAEVGQIVIHADRPKGAVVRELFGTEIKCDRGGQGLMTGLRGGPNEFRAVIMDPVEKLGFTFMRYKFMRASWNWEDGIGPMAARPDDRARQKYMGVDEVMAFQMRTIGDASRCHMVVNPRNPEQSAALVAYLNVPADEPEKNRHDWIIGVSKENGRDYKTIGYWAKLRASHGHAEPFGVRWFELGNENYMKDAGFDGEPYAYCGSAQNTTKAMKMVDPGVRVGLNLEAYPTKNQAWRDVVIAEGGRFADYFVCHAYYPMTYPRLKEYAGRITNLGKSRIEELYYKMIMAGAHQGYSDWKWFRGLMKRLTPRADQIGLCLTENGFHLEYEDTRAQNTVLVGVYDADELGMMVEYARELGLANANLFYLDGDNPWAFIQHTYEDTDDNAGVTVRPPYHALFMWTHYFGETLLTTDVRCGTFGIPMPEGDDWSREGILWSRIAAQEGIPLLAAHSSLSGDGNTLFLVVINRSLYDGIDARVRINGFAATGYAETHILNTSVKAVSGKPADMFAVWDSNNEEVPGTVRIRDARIKVGASGFSFRFPAHSATAVVLKRRPPG